MHRISVETHQGEELVDITGQVQELVAGEGLCVIYAPHTTVGILVNEGADPDVQADLLSHLRKLVPKNAEFRHMEGNSDAHIKASLIGNSRILVVSKDRLLLGTWERVFLCEFDGPRRRTIWVKVVS